MGIATIDIAADRLEPVNEIAKRRLGRRLSPATLWRWATKGVVASDGHRVKLETVKVAGSWHTTEAAFTAFLRAQNPQPDPDDSNARDPSTERRLRAAGLL